MRRKILFLVGILVLISSVFLVSATYTRSFNPQLQFRGDFQGNSFGLFDRQMCEAGQDFVLQVAPFGCSPPVVRSDLLEEQNDPIFCQISGTQINPLIDIEAIDYITLTGEYPPEVAGIGYQPARAALGQYGPQNINSPVLNNLGYVIINLKKQPNESMMPDYVSGNLTAKIRYDIKNAFGIGRSTHYVPVLNQDEWEDDVERYGFWDGRGYLKTESLDENGARISVYSGVRSGNPGGSLTRLNSVELKKGETSQGLIYMPGFDYCTGGMSLKLEDIENPDTRVRLSVNGDSSEFQDEEEFLEGFCKIKNIKKEGLVQTTEILCKEDEGTNRFDLRISPKFKLKIGEQSSEDVKEYEVGDKLYEVEGGTESVYLAYVRTDVESVLEIDEEDLKFYLVRLRGIKEKLSNDEISALEDMISGLTEEVPENLVNLPLAALKSFSSAFRSGVSFFTEGQVIKEITYENPGEFYGKNVQFLSFADAKNLPLEEEVQEDYENAKEDYERVIEAFSQETYPSDYPITLGEKAYQEVISLANDLGQKKDVLVFCEGFKQEFGDEIIPSKCEDKYKISSDEISTRYVEINGEIYKISLEGTKEPKFEEYGATIQIRYSDGTLFKKDFRKNEVFYLDESGEESIQLIKVDEESVNVRVDLTRAIVETAKEGFLGIEEKTLRKEQPDDFGGDYVFSLVEVNLEKLAKVSVNPEIKRGETEAEFPFKVGIEKRNIQLTPEQTRDKIESWNETLVKLEKIEDVLGKVVKVGKTSCLVTAGGLIVKNFFSNIGGAGIARQNVMRGEEGWFKKCEQEYKNGAYGSVDQCLLENNDAIEADVSAVAGEIGKENQEIDSIEGRFSEGGLFGEVIDTKKVYETYVDSSFKDNLVSRIESEMGETIEIEGNPVPVRDIIALIGSSNTLLSEARDLNVNSRLLVSGDENLKAIAMQEIKSELIEVWINSKSEKEKDDFAEKYGFEEAIVSVPNQKDYVVSDVKRFNNVKNNFNSNSHSKIDDSSFVYPFLYKHGSNQEKILFVLDDDYNIIQTYLITSIGNLEEYSNEQTNPLNIDLEKIDGESYKNKYKNPEIRFYDSGKYENLPAIVPFDTDDGWYAAIKPTLPIGRSMGSYEDSGRISSFFVCNVGENGEEEFSSGTSDDICQMINLGTGQPYNQFPGLSENEASNLVDCSVSAIRQASEEGQRRDVGDKISIRTTCGGTEIFTIGKTYVGTPDIQCQDFMSPSDCNLLFNICDPFVCPNSRCDFGGEYPVDDVVQSGIIGSTLLCLPNFPEVKVPICLTGIHAGVDGLTEVIDSYTQCLQTSLDTGQTVGICDEINSVYMCDLLWREAKPLGELFVKEGVERVFGQGGSGGGEYLTVEDSFDRASESVDYITDYYAANSFEAFKARSIQNAGTEVCKSWISGAYPDMGSLLDALTQPDSPAQFHGTFQEIEYTSTTNPPISHYKVFYFIFSGRDSPAIYEVYLKGNPSYFGDTNYRRVVAAGSLDVGEKITQTKDFTAPSGYNELCIIVNGQEECGFQTVSTSLATDIIRDQYIKDQALEENIDSAEDCVSGTPKLDVLMSLNPQSAVEDAINPEIYNKGIIRVCSTESPGKGSDPSFGTEDARWKEVGNCGQENLKCWLDAQSVENIVRSSEVEDEILSVHEEKALNSLKESGDYITNFEGFLDGLKGLRGMDLVNNITDNINKVFYNNQKGHLYWLRGNALGEIALSAYQNLVSQDDDDEDEPETEEPETEEDSEGEGSFYSDSHPFLDSLSEEMSLSAFNHLERSNDATPEYIVLHHSASGSVEATLLALIKNRNSIHYIVGKDGRIVRVVPEELSAQHANCLNSLSIGIEIVNLGEGEDEYTESQKESLSKLVHYLIDKYNIETGNLIGHGCTNPQKDDSEPRGLDKDFLYEDNPNFPSGYEISAPAYGNCPVSCDSEGQPLEN